MYSLQQNRSLTWKLLMVAASVVLCLYLIFDPASSAFFPRCPFFHMTGLQCPVCGSQRALHAFLNGHLTEAVVYNPFLILSLPFLAGITLTTFSHSDIATRIRKYIQSRQTVNAYIVSIVVWWIIRNIV